MGLNNELLNKFFSYKNLGHAYLISSNKFQDIIEIAKYIFKQSSDCIENIDDLILRGTYSDLRIIKPDGQWIKKEQITELKDEFKAKSIYDNKRIYIIANAENLNKSSANALLKFLEEPDDDIIALLLTSNVNKVLGTIVSRCQYISLFNGENNVTVDDNMFDIFAMLEENNVDCEIKLQKIISNVGTRDDIRLLLTGILNIYSLLLDMKINGNLNEKYTKYLELNTLDMIQKKNSALIFAIDALEYNVNIKLLVDKILFLMFGAD